MYNDEDYLFLIKALAKITEGLPIKSESDGILEGFVLRIFTQASSLKNLFKHTEIYNSLILVDTFSINVILRSALENYLIFHYLYIAPKTEEQKHERFYLWKLAGLYTAQRYIRKSPRGKREAITEKEEIEKIQNEIHFDESHFDKKHLEKIKSGIFPKPQWGDLMKIAGFQKIHIVFYKHLCEYAHSGYFSIGQYMSLKGIEEQRRASRGAMGVMMIVMTKLIYSLFSIYPEKIEENLRVYIESALADYEQLDEMQINWDELGPEFQ